MIKIFYFFLVAIISLASFTVKAQQDPMYTHYMYNTLVINPAYAGSRDALTLTALHRSQWVGFKGAPSSQTLSIHAPLKNQHFGLGLSLLNDRVSVSNNTSVMGDFSGIVKLTEKAKLAVGINAGVNIFNANLSQIELDQQQDPVFVADVNNHVTTNLGLGVYYSTTHFYTGISIPNVLQNNYSASISNSGDNLIAKEQRHYFLIAGAMIPIVNNLSFKPTMLVKATNAAPVQLDLTASFVIVKRLTIGAMFRTGDAFGSLIGFDFTNQFHLGYSFDWSYRLETSKYNQGSHEILLRYDFMLYGTKQIRSPRYF